MNKLRGFAIAALAAATVTIGTLASVPTAAAMEKTCAQKYTIAAAYWSYGAAYYGMGQYAMAYYWFGRSEELMVGC